MTTPPTAGLQPLPVVAWMTEHDNGPMLWSDHAEAQTYCDVDEEPEPLVKLSDALAAIACQGDAVDYVLDLLVAAGHISREKAFHARDIAREFHSLAITAKDAK